MLTASLCPASSSQVKPTAPGPQLAQAPTRPSPPLGLCSDPPSLPSCWLGSRKGVDCIVPLLWVFLAGSGLLTVVRRRPPTKQPSAHCLCLHP